MVGNTCIMKLYWIKRDIVIAFIIRSGKIIIPNGLTTLEKEDRVIIITTAKKNLSDISDIVEK